VDSGIGIGSFLQSLTIFRCTTKTVVSAINLDLFLKKVVFLISRKFTLPWYLLIRPVFISKTDKIPLLRQGKCNLLNVLHAQLVDGKI